jgi:hypothetical protein
MKRNRLLSFAAALGLFAVLIPAGASVAVGAPAPSQPTQSVQITFIKVLCPSYSVVPANQNPTNKDATGGHGGQLDPSYQIVLTNPATDIPKVCSRADGWQFQMYNSSGLGTTVGAPVTTGADGSGTGATTITLDGTELALAQTAGSPTGLWIAEIQQPSVAAFGAIRCGSDILNGDLVENIRGVGLTNQHLYCIAYNVDPNLNSPSPTAAVTASPTVVASTAPTASSAGSPTGSPFQSFQGETAAGNTPTPPATSTSGVGSNPGSSPLPGLLIALAFAGLALIAVQTQRRSIRR